MSFKKSIKPIVVTSLNTNALGAPYQAINPSGLPNTCTEVHIVNGSTIGVTLSFDGAIAHDYIPSGNTLKLTFLNTDSTGIYNPLTKKGQKFYVSSAVGVGVGFIYVCGYYQESV